MRKSPAYKSRSHGDDNCGVFSEVGGRTGCRISVRDAAGETESALLHEAVPSWVADVVIDRNIPRFIKIPFFLLPHPQMVKQDRMKKVSVNMNQFQVHHAK